MTGNKQKCPMAMVSVFVCLSPKCVIYAPFPCLQVCLTGNNCSLTITRKILQVDYD